MKKTIRKKLALLLSLCMVLGVFPVPVMAAEAHTHEGYGNDIEFTAWEKTDSLPTTAGNYYLTSDVSISSTWVVSSGISLDLCGYDITMTGSQTVIRVKGGATFCLYDCIGDGKITGGVGNSSTNDTSDDTSDDASAGGVAVAGSSTFNMYGGNITENDAGTKGLGGGVFVYDTSATFNMYGGVISKNTAYQSGGVQNQGTFNMYGGTISENIGTHSIGGVFIYDNCIMTMSGDALIKGNISKEACGGGISLNNGAELTILGNASIENNKTADAGGGIYNYGGTVTISENASVKNNSADFAAGGIQNISATGKVSLSDNVTVTGNSSAGRTGGIDNSGGNVVISDNVLIEGNTATTDGGGIYNSGTIEVKGNVIITRNSAKRYGGGIFNFDTIEITENVSVIENTAEAVGGGIFNFKHL